MCPVFCELSVRLGPGGSRVHDVLYLCIVGKTTLTFHLGHILASMGHPTLFIDLDPQCNLTICGMDTEVLHKIWEDPFIYDFESARKCMSPTESRSIHFIVKPTEDGTGDLDNLPPPYRLGANLGLLPGRLTMHMFEDKISSRWSQVYSGDPLAIKTASRIRTIASEYAKIHGYEYVIIDTSPSLGMMNCRCKTTCVT
jgi:cellulose biosynthesis protein BcsQ